MGVLQKKILIRCLNIMVLFMNALFCLLFFRTYETGFALAPSAARNIFLYSTFYVFFISIFDLYKVGTIRLVDVFCGLVFAVPGTNLLFFIQLWLAEDNLAKGTVLGFLLLTLVQLLFGGAASFFLHRSYIHLVPPLKLVAVAGNKPEDTIFWNQKMENQYFSVAETVGAEEKPEFIIEKAKNRGGLLLGDLPAEQRSTLMRRCFHEGIPSFYMMKISDIMVQNAKRYKLYDQVFLMNQNQGLSDSQAAMKRIMDAVLSALLLIILSPLCIVIMICIRREDKGPVIYRQKRLTKNGRQFDIYKFRSMAVDAEKDGPRLAKKSDSRITKTGRIIRNLHFDEIPQLLNVLKGDMSLVGPRPERSIFTEEYQKILPEFESRLKVKAGLTGYAQVYGNYNTNPYDKLKLDLIYINHYSLFLDIKLLFQTVRILFQKENLEVGEYGEKN